MDTQAKDVREFLDEVKSAIHDRDALKEVGGWKVIQDALALRDAVLKVAGPVALAATMATTRFVKLDASGNTLAPTAADYVGVLDNTTGLLWSRHIGTAKNWAEAKTMAAIDLLGAPAHLPTDKELESLIDRSRHSPACDTTFFGDTKTDDWYWTSTEHASNSSNAWIVGFGSGYVHYHPQGSDGVVRACRRFSPGQCI